MGGKYTTMSGYNKCGICTVGEAMRQFVAEGKGHMEWNMGLQTFDKASPQDPPMMEAQVKVLCQIKKKFV